MLPFVDFHALLLPGRDKAGKALSPVPGAMGRAVDDPNWETQVLPKLDAGHPLYVRVIPNVGEIPVCEPSSGGVPPEVLVAHVVPMIIPAAPEPDNKVSVGQLWYTKPDYGARPYTGETCYRFVKDHKVKTIIEGGSAWDMIVAAHMSGVSFGDTATRNRTFCVPPSSGGSSFIEDFFESWGAVLTGAFDALVDAVNYLSKLWEEIQDAVVDAVAKAVDSVGIIDCGPKSACRGALETGLEVGLAAMGVPPSLPNYDELINQGFDYLAAEVASQTGVPSEVVDYASQKAQDFVKKAADNMRSNYDVSGMPDWLVPDIRFNPAYLTMELYGPGLSEPFYSTPTLMRTDEPIYRGASVELPIRLPEQGVDLPILFPMVLQPNVKGLTPCPSTTIMTLAGQVKIPPTAYEKAVWNKNQWIPARYASPFGGCYNLWLYVVSNHPAGGGLIGYIVRDNNFMAWDPSIACEP